jgi:hypothetical protein
MDAVTLGLPKPYQFAYYVASLQVETARYSEKSRKETPNFWPSHMPYLTMADMKTFHFKFATTNDRQTVYRNGSGASRGTRCGVPFILAGNRRGSLHRVNPYTIYST